jgi:hypothetical protein
MLGVKVLVDIQGVLLLKKHIECMRLAGLPI